MKSAYDIIISVDLETSGVKPWDNGILEIGAIVSDLKGNEIEIFQEYCNPGDVIYDPNALKVNKITMEQIHNARPIREVLIDFVTFMSKYIDNRSRKAMILGNNFGFDSWFFQYAFDKHVPEYDKKTKWFFRCLDDIKSVARTVLPELEHMAQNKMGDLLDVPNEDPHSSLGDARQMLGIYRKLMKINYRRIILAEQQKTYLDEQKLLVK